MPANKYVYVILCFLSVLCSGKIFSQCTIQQGPGPKGYIFNTGNDGETASVPAGFPDLHWTFTMDSINGKYAPAIVMADVPGEYYKSSLSNTKWISISANGQHSGERDVYFKIEFELPCTNLCGKPFAGIFAYQLKLDMFADNSVYRIYVNGVLQDPNHGGIIPLQHPYQGAGSVASGGVSALLSSGWKPGTNTVVVFVASSAPIVGLMVEGSVIKTPPLRDTVRATICKGGFYNFGGQQLTNAGEYSADFHPAPGCDSTATLILNVLADSVTIDTTICQGQSYFGHTASGTYTDRYVSSNGCDSCRTVRLTVFNTPHPDIARDSLLCIGDSIVIWPGNFSSYLWQDGSTRDHYVVKKPGLYTVTVTGAPICGPLKSAVYVNEVVCNYIIFPTAFTPNQDGHNDVFRVLTRQQLPGYHLAVYNRLGQKIFESRDPAKGWDGIVNGKQQGTGTYVWFCTFKKGDVVTKMKGTVVLLR